MAEKKRAFGNITVRLEEAFLARLQRLEESTGLNRSELTRQCLDALLRQFERTGQVSFPLELADVPLDKFMKSQERLGELSSMLLVAHERLNVAQQEEMSLAKERDRLNQQLLSMLMEEAQLKSKVEELQQEVARLKRFDG